MSLSLRVWTEVTIHAHLPSSPNKNQSRKIPWKVQGVYSKLAGNSWFITLKVSTIQPFSRYTRWDFPAFLDEYHPLTWLKFFGQQKRIQHFPLKISLDPNTSGKIIYKPHRPYFLESLHGKNLGILMWQTYLTHVTLWQKQELTNGRVLPSLKLT